MAASRLARDIPTAAGCRGMDGANPGLACSRFSAEISISSTWRAGRRVDRRYCRLFFRAALWPPQAGAADQSGQNLGRSHWRFCGRPGLWTAGQHCAAAVRERLRSSCYSDFCGQSDAAEHYWRPLRVLDQTQRRRQRQWQLAARPWRCARSHRQPDGGIALRCTVFSARARSFMKRLAILGSTGSIGISTLAVVDRHPDRFEVVALSANKQVDRLLEQCRRYRPRFAAMANEAAAKKLRHGIRESGLNCEVLSGSTALERIASAAEVDAVMAAIVGSAGLPSTLAAARAGKQLLLANKEALVMAGGVVGGGGGGH